MQEKKIQQAANSGLQILRAMVWNKKAAQD